MSKGYLANAGQKVILDNWVGESFQVTWVEVLNVQSQVIEVNGSGQKQADQLLGQLLQLISELIQKLVVTVKQAIFGRVEHRLESGGKHAVCVVET